MLRKFIPLSSAKASTKLAPSLFSSSSCCLRFNSTTSSQQKPDIADISPYTAAQAQQHQEEILEARIDRFREDMYTMPVFNPFVMLMTTIGFAGFLITWGYFVATPVYNAYMGKSSEESGTAKEGEELD
jgi:hypothetical protein